MVRTLSIYGSASEHNPSNMFIILSEILVYQFCVMGRIYGSSLGLYPSNMFIISEILEAGLSDLCHGLDLW